MAMTHSTGSGSYPAIGALWSATTIRRMRSATPWPTTRGCRRKPPNQHRGRGEVIRLTWQRGSSNVAWDYDGAHTQVALDEVPEAVVAWEEPPSVIVLEQMGKRLDNAVVYNPDGAERLRLVPPYAIVAELSRLQGFYTICVSRDVLTAVYATTVGDFWGVPDLTTGELANVTEWR